MGIGLEPVTGGVNVVRQGGLKEVLWCVVSCHLQRAKAAEGLLTDFGINMGAAGSSGTSGCRAFEMPGAKNNEVQFISLTVDTEQVRAFLSGSDGILNYPEDPFPQIYEPPDGFQKEFPGRTNEDFNFVQNSTAGGGLFRFKIHLDAFINPGSNWNQPDFECDQVPVDSWPPELPNYTDGAWIQAALETYDLFMTFDPCERGVDPGADPRNALVKTWFGDNCFSVPDTFCKKHCHDKNKACLEEDQEAENCDNANGQFPTLLFNLTWPGFKFKQPESGDLKVGAWCASSVNVSTKAPKNNSGGKSTAHVLTKGINYFDGISSGLNCKSTSCTTGEPFRKYLYDLMARELAAGGFPYIVPGSHLPSQAILVGGTEIFNGYTLSGRYVEREELMSETITRMGFNKKIKIKPKLDDEILGKAGQIGFAVDGKRRDTYMKMMVKDPDTGDMVEKLVKKEPNLEKKDIWTATVFGSFVATETWEMINIWKQTIEASIYCPSGGGRCCEREQDQVTGKWKLKDNFKRPKNCPRPYKEIVGPAGAPVFFTAHELALEKMFIAKYSTMAANLGVNIENKYISFSAAIATSHSDKAADQKHAGQYQDDNGDDEPGMLGTFHVNARIQIKRLLSLIGDGRWGKAEITDSLTYDIPTYTFGEDVIDKESYDKDGEKIKGGTIPSFSLKDIKYTFGIQMENNLSISLSGFKPFDLWNYEEDPTDPNKKIKTLKPISMSIKYQLEDARMLTIDLDTDGNWALGLAIEWERADFKNEWVGRMMDNTIMQMGLAWDQQKGKQGGFEPSWVLNKAFGDVFSTQWDILRGEFSVAANLFSDNWGDVKHGLGKVQAGVTASWRPFNLYDGFFEEDEDSKRNRSTSPAGGTKTEILDADGVGTGKYETTSHTGKIKDALPGIVKAAAGPPSAAQKAAKKIEQELGVLSDKEKDFTWIQLMPKMKATLRIEKEFHKTASIFGNVTFKSNFGASLGNTTGILDGWSLTSKGLVIVELENRMLQFLHLPINVHPHLANGFHFMVGNRESEYFGSKWGGFEFAMSLGLFGYRFSKVSRHDAILGILDKRRYSNSLNFGFLPWGKIEDDGDYVARTFPCLMHNIAKFCEENWYENLIESVEKGGNPALTADCDYLKDYYYPLKKLYWDKGGAYSKKTRESIAHFYLESVGKTLGGSKLVQRKKKVERLNEDNELVEVEIMVATWVKDSTAMSEEQKCNRKVFDTWEPVIATRKHWPRFPYDIPEGILSEGPEGVGGEYQGAFSEEGVKSYLYYVREINLFRSQQGCTDEMPANWKKALKSQTGYLESIGSVEGGRGTGGGSGKIHGMGKKDGIKDGVRFANSTKAINILNWGQDTPPFVGTVATSNVLFGYDLPQFCRTENGRVKPLRKGLKRAYLRWAGWYESDKLGDPDFANPEQGDRVYTLRQRYINKYIKDNKGKEIRSLFKRQTNVATELMKERMDNLNVENSFTDNFSRLYWLTQNDKTKSREGLRPNAGMEGGVDASNLVNDWYRKSGRKKYYKEMGITTVEDKTYKEFSHKFDADGETDIEADTKWHLDDEYGYFPCGMNNKKGGATDSILNTPLGFIAEVGKSVIEMLTFGHYFSKRRKVYDGAIDQYYSDGRFGLMKATWSRDAPFGSINLWQNQKPPNVDIWRTIGNFLGATMDQERWSLIMLGKHGGGQYDHMDWSTNGLIKDPGKSGGGGEERSGAYQEIWKIWNDFRKPGPSGWEFSDGTMRAPYIDMGSMHLGGGSFDPLSDLRGSMKMKTHKEKWWHFRWNRNMPAIGIIIRVGDYYLAVGDYRYYYLPYDPNSPLSILNREFRRKVKVCTNANDPHFTENFLHLTVDQSPSLYERMPIIGDSPIDALVAEELGTLGATKLGHVNTRRGWEYKENKSISTSAGSGSAATSKATLLGDTVLVYPAESDPGIQCSKWYNNFFYSEAARGFYNTIGYYMLPSGNKHPANPGFIRKTSKRYLDYRNSADGTGATAGAKNKEPSWVTPICADWLNDEKGKFLWIGIDGLIWSKKASMDMPGANPWADYRHIAKICCCAVSINPDPSQNEGFLNTIQNVLKIPFTDLRIFPETQMKGIGRLWFWKWQFSEEKVITPGFCAMPWKGNPDSCHLSFYRFMHEIWLRYMALFMSEWGKQTQDASDIDAFCRAKVNIVRFCGYNKTSTEDKVLWDSTYGMYSCISGIQEGLPIPDYITDNSIPCVPLGTGGGPVTDMLQTTITPEKYFTSQTLNGQVVDGVFMAEGTSFRLGCRFVAREAKRLNHSVIGEVVDIRDFLRAKDKLAFVDVGHCNKVDVVFKGLWGKYEYIFERFQYIKRVLDDALMALRDELCLKFTDPTGNGASTVVYNGKNFVGNYCEGDAVTNLEEIMTLKKKVEFHASGAFTYIKDSSQGTTFSSKSDNDENVIWLGSKALAFVSDPFDGYRYGDQVITHAGMQHPMGRNQMFGTTFAMSSAMNKAWATTKAAYDGVGWTFPNGRLVMSGEHSNEYFHWSAGRNTWNPCTPSARLTDMLGPKKGDASKWGEPKIAADRIHLVKAWVNYTKTFEDFYPILIDPSSENLRERVDGTKANFYGMLENDLRAFHLINMRLFCPWVEVATAIGAKMKAGELELGKGLEILYDFLYPIFIHNYPGMEAINNPEGRLPGTDSLYGAKEMEMKYLWKLVQKGNSGWVQSYYRGIGKHKGLNYGRDKIIDAARRGKIGANKDHDLWARVSGSYSEFAKAGYSDPKGSDVSKQRRIVYKEAFMFHILEDVLYYIYNITGLIRGVALPGEGKHADPEFSAYREIILSSSNISAPLPLGRLFNRATQRKVEDWAGDHNACTESMSIYRETEGWAPWQREYAIEDSPYLPGIQHRILHRIRTINAGEAGRALENEHMFTGFWGVLDPDPTGD